MNTALWILAVLLIAVGVAGTVLPALPGVILVLAGIVLGAWIGDFMPLAGAVAGQYLVDRDLIRARNVGLATWLGIAIGMVAKVALTFLMIGIFVAALLIP